MVKLEHFNEVIARFSNIADFLIIYIEEAHPSDGWKFGNNIEINYHRNLQERIAAAKRLQSFGPKCSIVVDNMRDEANLQYGGLYERLYIVLNDVIVFAGERGPVGYRVEEIEQWLENYHS